MLSSGMNFVSQCFECENFIKIFLGSVEFPIKNFDTLAVFHNHHNLSNTAIVKLLLIQTGNRNKTPKSAIIKSKFISNFSFISTFCQFFFSFFVMNLSFPHLSFRLDCFPSLTLRLILNEDTPKFISCFIFAENLI